MGRRVLLAGASLALSLTWYFFAVSWRDASLPGLIEVEQGRVFACQSARPTGLASASRTLGIGGVVLVGNPGDAQLLRHSCGSLGLRYVEADVAPVGRAAAQSALDALRVMGGSGRSPVLIVYGAEPARAAELAALHLALKRGLSMSASYERTLELMGESRTHSPALLMDWGGVIARAYESGHDIPGGPAGAQR